MGVEKILKPVFKAVGIQTETPKVDTSQASNIVESQADKSKKARTAIFETEGGVLGEELQEGQVSKRRTLLGN